MSTLDKLNLTWLMKSFLKDYKDKPQQYVSWLVGHEGEGSLISFLRKKVWALGIYTGSENGIDHSTLFCFFNMTIVLTQEGLNNVDKVIDAVFGYINMLKKNCPDERVFKEMQTIEEINFRFNEEVQSADNVEHLAENMQYYPPEHYITGSDLFFDYNPESIKYVIDCLSPETVNIMVHSHNHEEPIKYDCLEEWFMTEYKKNCISTESEERWRNMIPEESFQLPLVNVFIPDNFDLIPMQAEAGSIPDTNKTKKPKKTQSLTSNSSPETSTEENDPKTPPASSKPALIRNDEFMELWYLPDYKFRLPSAIIYVNFLSPMGALSVEDSVKLELWSEVMRQALRDQLYAADMAGLTYSLVARDMGLVLNFYGFSQKLHILVDVVTKTIKNYDAIMENQLFTAVKDILTKRYHNIIIKPGKLVRAVRLKLLVDYHWTAMDKLEVIGDLKFEDMKDVGKNFLKKMRAQILVEGNLLEGDALAVGETAYNNLKWIPMAEVDRPKPRTYRIPDGETYCCIRSFNQADSNCNVSNFYQAEMYTLKDACILDLLIMLMEEPLFNTLRTKEQLGYSVHCSVRYTFGVLAFLAVVNSQVDKFSTEHVDKRIESFLKGFVKELKNLPEKTYQQTKQALIKVKRCAAVELKDDITRHWSEIDSFEYNFQRTPKEVECLKKLTKAEVIAWYKKFGVVGKSNTVRKLSIQVIGTKPDSQTQNQATDKATEPADEKAVDTVMKFPLRFCNQATMDPGKVYITDIEEFKKKLPLFPEVEEYLRTEQS